MASEISQKQASKNYRRRLKQHGLSSFQVLGLTTDRELIRSLAKRLADNDMEATRLRAVVCRSILGEAYSKGGILRALRSSPLVGADLDLTRISTETRKVDI